MVFNTGMFTQSFMIHAWISATIVAVICTFIGFFIVIRGSSFIAHALPEIGFAGGAGSVLLNIDPLYGLAAFTVAGALLIGYLGRKERDDVVTALTLVTALGTGALFLGLTNDYAAGAYALLFGQIVGVSSIQVMETAVLGFICLLFICFLYRPLILVSLSPEIAQSRGMPVKFIEISFLLIIGVCVAITVPIVGALLCFSLLIAPNAAGIYLSSNPPKVLAISLLFSVASVWISLVLAYITGLPTGFFVSVIGAALYSLSRYLHLRHTKNIKVQM